MKVNDRLNLKINKKDANSLTLSDENNKITLTVDELKEVLKTYEKEMQKEESKHSKLDKIKSKIAECEAHGFTVKKERDWLWITGNDGRYDETITGILKLGSPTEVELTDKSKEIEIIKSLGFEYSSWRMAHYWDSRK